MSDTRLIARIAFPFRECFDYEVPEALKDSVVPGAAVIVPLGPRQLIGYVIELLPPDSDKLGPHKFKPVRQVVEEIPPLPSDLLKLANFIADYYFCSLGDALRLLVPTPVRRRVIRHYKLTDTGKALVKAQPEHPAAVLKRAKTTTAMRQKLKLSARDVELLLSEWQAQGFVHLDERLSIGGGSEALVAAHTASSFTPSSEQAAALDAFLAALDARRYQAFLLWGVTGSGKTEVYLATIERALQQGKTAIVMVPEIGLTPQLESRFAARFGSDVVTIHSGLTPAEKRKAWTRVQSGSARVVVGPRSALFAPLANLGVIIVDEEHDESYKQDENPRYHARDLALVRAHHAQALAVLGSATPSLESLHNVHTQKLTQVRMMLRPTGGTLPEVQIIPLAEPVDPDQPAPKRKVKSGRDVPMFSPELTDAVVQTVARGEQVILFLNRRGFAPFVLCQSCGEGFKCPHCSVSLTHHLKRNVLLCHYCNYWQPPPVECPKCQSINLRISGTGTERLEIELQRAFPNYKIGRLDRDVVDSQEALKRTLKAFRDGELQILLGTQMVTKGHDFPLVTLVGVLLADSSLNFPDFRAAERTAQMLVQVAGRAGRGDRPGRVVVQSYHPEHLVLTTAQSHDYAAFTQQELIERQALNYPPYARLLMMRFEDESDEVAAAFSSLVAEQLRRTGHAIEVMGPAPCPISRIKGMYRRMLMVKSASSREIRLAVRQALKGIETPKTTKLVLDADPVAMM